MRKVWLGLESIGFSAQEEFNVDFQDGRRGGYLVFLTGTIFAFFRSACHIDTMYFL